MATKEQILQAEAPTATPPPRFSFDRFTLAVVLVTLALVGLGVAAVLVRPADDQPMDESRPAGVVHNYYLALANDDPKKAYEYLSAEARSKLPYERFASGYPARSVRSQRPTIRIDDEKVEGDTARVTIRWTRTGGGLFGPSDYSSVRTSVLRLEDGAWKLTQAESLW